MPRFGATRLSAAVFGLAGLVAIVGITPAHAVHITLTQDPPDNSGIAAIGEPLVIFGVADSNDISAPGGEFTHTYNFGFDIDPLPEGPGGVSVTPNFLAPNVGFDMFAGSVTGPTITGTLDLIRDEPPQLPRINRLAATFSAIDTGGDTPYTLTISGSLLPDGTVGNYTGNINVTPLPGAALLFLSALGGLFAVRRYRQTAAPA